MRNTTDSRAAVAFNVGCRARELGLPMTDNPYRSSKELAEYLAWGAGWQEIDKNYGADAKWPVRPLPEVRR